MFAVIYRFHLKSEQEATYKKSWDIVTDYFVQHRGALGSCLHQSDDGLWVAYSRWPDRATRDASWSGDNAPSHTFPEAVIGAIRTMQKIKKNNANLVQYDEIAMDVVIDKL